MLRRGKCMEFMEALKNSPKSKEEIKTIGKLSERQYQYARKILIDGGLIEKIIIKTKGYAGYMIKYKKIK